MNDRDECLNQSFDQPFAFINFYSFLFVVQFLHDIFDDWDLNCFQLFFCLFSFVAFIWIKHTLFNISVVCSYLLSCFYSFGFDCLLFMFEICFPQISKLTCKTLWCLVLCCLVLSCLVLSCLVLSCLTWISLGMIVILSNLIKTQTAASQNS